LSDYLALRREF